MRTTKVKKYGKELTVTDEVIDGIPTVTSVSVAEETFTEEDFKIKLSDVLPPVPVQAPLLPTVPVQTRMINLDARELDPGNAKPSAALRRSIAQLDAVLSPIIVYSDGDRYHILEGRRRVRAAQEVQAKEPGRPFPIPALAILNWKDFPNITEVISILGNQMRSDSPEVELDELSSLIRKGYTEHDINQATGMPVQSIKKRLRLMNLSPDLRRAYRAGRMADGVAEAAAKLNSIQQMDLIERFAMGRPEDDTPWRFTAAHVAAVRAASGEVVAAPLFGPEDVSDGAGGPSTVIIIEAAARRAVSEWMSRSTFLVVAGNAWDQEDYSRSVTSAEESVDVETAER